MLTDLFYKVLILSLTGTIIFFILTILKPVTKKIFSPCWNYYLIIITVITFIIPYGALMPKGEESLIDIPTFMEEKSSIVTNKDIEVMKNNFTYTKEAIKVTDKIVSYAWATNNDLTYSTEKGGLNGFNLKTKKSSTYVKSEERYEDMVSDKKGTMYVNIYRYYTKDGREYVEAKGLIRYDLALAKESLIIPARTWNDDKGDTGLNPLVAGISKNGEFVYIWCKSRGGSLNADGVPFGVYEMKSNKFTPYDDKQIFALAYKDNLAINPVDEKIFVLNNGGVRDMNINKTIGTIDAIKGNFNPVLPEDMMSTDKDLYNTTARGNNFDFAPNYISKGKDIIFARKTGEDTISLFRLKGNKEECMAKDIKLDEDAGFYGHEKLEKSLAIYAN